MKKLWIFFVILFLLSACNREPEQSTEFPKDSKEIEHFENGNGLTPLPKNDEYEVVPIPNYKGTSPNVIPL